MSEETEKLMVFIPLIGILWLGFIVAAIMVWTLVRYVITGKL